MAISNEKLLIKVKK